MEAEYLRQCSEASAKIGEIQSRLFEIQELRHQDVEPSQDRLPNNGTASVIDEALMKLDTSIDETSSLMDSLSLSMETLRSNESDHSGTLLPEVQDSHKQINDAWNQARTEADNLRNELREDKWLAVFRVASDQADGMMDSLERVVRQCESFIHLQSSRTSDATNPVSDLSSILETKATKDPVALAQQLRRSLEAKKTYYVPSVTKVLNVLDKGVRDRVTKNGETLRRHADMRARWETLKTLIASADTRLNASIKVLEMDQIRSGALSPTSLVSQSSVNPRSQFAPGTRPAASVFRSAEKAGRSVSARRNESYLATPGLPARRSLETDPPGYINDALTPPSAVQSRPFGSQDTSPGRMNVHGRHPPLSSSNARRPDSRLSYSRPDSRGSSASASPSHIPVPSNRKDTSTPAHPRPRSLLPPRSVHRTPSPSPDPSRLSQYRRPPSALSQMSYNPRYARVDSASRPNSRLDSSQISQTFQEKMELAGLPLRPTRSVFRNRSVTPGYDNDTVDDGQEYKPANPKDPLDVQVAIIANSILHGYTIERIDPPLRGTPRPGEELKAQYSLSDSLGKRTLTCRLLVINRSAPRTLEGAIQTKKVMCRVGGGWQDLEQYLLAHRATKK